jgi:hypothetical protein
MILDEERVRGLGRFIEAISHSFDVLRQGQSSRRAPPPRAGAASLPTGSRIGVEATRSADKRRAGDDELTGRELVEQIALACKGAQDRQCVSTSINTAPQYRASAPNTMAL